jgi:hypothetical protein
MEPQFREQQSQVCAQRRFTPMAATLRVTSRFHADPPTRRVGVQG